MRYKSAEKDPSGDVHSHANIPENILNTMVIIHITSSKNSDSVLLFMSLKFIEVSTLRGYIH
jgi:hypothetical protein